MTDKCISQMLLSAYLDGELDDTKTLQVRNHIDNCDSCREDLAALQAADRMILASDTIEPSAGFERNFWHKISELEQQQPHPVWKQWLMPGWRPALAIGLSACIAVGVWKVMNLDDEMSPEEIVLADNIEFLNDYEVIRNLDILQNWDNLDAIKERT